MGCGASNPYATFEGTIKGDDKWVSFTKKFDISKPEAKKLFLAYQKMDKRKTGEASFKDFCRVWNGGAEDEIIGRFFLQIDKDEEDASGEMTTGNDVLYFQEWVVMTYDFLTLRTDGLVDWTFKIFDPDDSGSINIQEFKEMVRLCRGDKYVEKGTAEFQETVKLMKELDSNGNGKITKAEFAKAEKSCAILFWPLIELQTVMRKKLFGDKWWANALKQRYARLGGGGKTPMAVYEGGGAYTRPTKNGGVKKNQVAPSARSKK